MLPCSCAHYIPVQVQKAPKAPPANPLEDSPLNFSLPPPPEKLSDIKVGLASLFDCGSESSGKEANSLREYFRP